MFRLHLPLDDDQLRAIGLVAARWSYLDYELELTVVEIAGVSRSPGRALTMHMTTPLRLRVLAAMTQEFFNDATIEQVDKLIRRFKGVQTKRTAIIHGVWSVSPEGPAAIMWRIKDAEIILQKDPMSAADITKVADEIQELIGDFSEFRREDWKPLLKPGASPPPSRDKS